MNERVYLLWFVRENEHEQDTELLIGVYATEADARSAIARLSGKPGFIDNPEAFQIHAQSIGQDSWGDGFVAAP